jgi:hypothetical protein
LLLLFDAKSNRWWCKGRTRIENYKPWSLLPVQIEIISRFDTNWYITIYLYSSFVVPLRGWLLDMWLLAGLLVGMPAQKHTHTRIWLTFNMVELMYKQRNPQSRTIEKEGVYVILQSLPLLSFVKWT